MPKAPFNLTKIGKFRDGDVDPSLWALAHLPSVLNAINFPNAALDASVGTWDTTKVSNEIEDLFSLRTDDQFGEFLAEIPEQASAINHYFYLILGIDPRSFPYTARLIALAIQVAGTVGLHYKLQKMRPRPSQVCPALVPIIPVPAHPSFPSNHATQVNLVAEVLKVALRSAAEPPAENGGLKTTLDMLADRIATNRERAGLHYRSDSDAGKRLAAKLAEQLIPQLETVDNVLARATSELADFQDDTSVRSLNLFPE